MLHTFVHVLVEISVTRHLSDNSACCNRMGNMVTKNRVTSFSKLAMKRDFWADLLVVQIKYFGKPLFAIMQFHFIYFL